LCAVGVEVVTDDLRRSRAHRQLTAAAKGRVVRAVVQKSEDAVGETVGDDEVVAIPSVEVDDRDRGRTAADVAGERFRERSITVAAEQHDAAEIGDDGEIGVAVPVEVAGGDPAGRRIDGHVHAAPQRAAGITQQDEQRVVRGCENGDVGMPVGVEISGRERRRPRGKGDGRLP
jgi:hypothetical protein